MKLRVVEIDTSLINEIEFEREGEIEIKFVPIRPGEYDFEIERLQSKGMVGKFIVNNLRKVIIFFKVLYFFNLVYNNF